MKLIVTGAGGWIGRNVCHRGVFLGYDIIGIDAVPLGNGPWSDTYVADISTNALTRLVAEPALQGVSAIIHCAGYAHRPRETPEALRLFDLINRVGTLNTVELARRLGIERIVYVSSIAFYDWSSGGIVDESSPLAPQTAYARSKLEGEMACVNSGLDWRIARLATVFGDGDRANFARLAAALGNKRFVVPGSGGARKSVIPVKLVAELLIDLAVRNAVPHRLVNIGLPSVPSLAQICAAYHEVCSFPRPLHLPVPVLALVANCGDMFAHIRPSFPFTSANIVKLTKDTVVDVNRMLMVWPGRKWPDFQEALLSSAAYYRSLCGTGQ